MEIGLLFVGTDPGLKCNVDIDYSDCSAPLILHLWDKKESY